MNDNKDKVLFYIKEFTKRHGYTPTTYQVSNELYMPQDKVSSIVEALKAEGTIQIHRPLT